MYTNWAKVFSAVFILSASIFVFLILLFWLCFLSDLRFMQQNGEGSAGRRGICYWIPKVTLATLYGAVWCGVWLARRWYSSLVNVGLLDDSVRAYGSRSLPRTLLNCFRPERFNTCTPQQYPYPSLDPTLTFPRAPLSQM